MEAYTTPLTSNGREQEVSASSGVTVVQAQPVQANSSSNPITATGVPHFTVPTAESTEGLLQFFDPGERNGLEQLQAGKLISYVNKKTTTKMLTNSHLNVKYKTTK
jgi:hypothetical protein